MSDKIQLLAPDESINFKSFLLRTLGLLFLGDVLGNIIESITNKIEQITGSRLSGIFQIMLNVFVIYILFYNFTKYVSAARDSIAIIFFHAAFFNSQTSFMRRISFF
jgi:hypothetical protein